MSRQRRTFALDFDGVLHRYGGWRDGYLDGPIDGALDAVQRFLSRGHTVVVFTTREQYDVVAWLAHYGFPALEVTNVKRPFYVLVDDRAVRFDGVWDEDVVRSIERFEPYWIKQRHKGADDEPQPQQPAG